MCLSCQADPDGGRHDAAPTKVGLLDECWCGAPLAVRKRDTPTHLGRRILGYRHRSRPIAAAADQAQIRWTSITADGDPATITRTVAAAVFGTRPARLTLRGGGRRAR
jgi:hypothetical protein